MISKKRRHKGLKMPQAPTTGRAAFRGILHPLILGGQSMAPSSTTTTSNFDPYSQATVTVPSNEPGPRDYCKLTETEQAWCDINPTFSWCNKVTLFADDPKCVPNNIKCPPSQQWIETFQNPDPQVQFGYLRDYLTADGVINGVNGQCIDEAIKEEREKEKEKEDEEKKEEQTKYDNWIRTRGCRYDNYPLQVGVKNSFIQTPCPFGTGDDNKPGQIKQYGGRQYKFIGWSPEQP